MSSRITVEQLERMKTHELAELLSNMVLLLKRLPDIEWKQLQQPLDNADIEHLVKQVPARSSAPITSADSFELLTEPQLRKKTVAQLKEIAKELHIVTGSKPLKDDLLKKILARQNTQGHSEQYAIQDL